MWRWIRRWIDWLRAEAIPLARMRRGGSVVYVRYDAAGRTRDEQPIPWTADAVTVEVSLRLPPAARRKADFLLHFTDGIALAADGVRPEYGDRYRVCFRFPVPQMTASGDLHWKGRPMVPVCVRVLSAAAYLAGLSIAIPAAVVRLGSHATAARAVGTNGLRGLLATAVIRSSHRLEQVADIGVEAIFRRERTGQLLVVPIVLTAEQRAGTEAVVVAACPRVPRRPGAWSVAWRIGGREIAARRLEVVPGHRFEESVQVLDARFAVADKAGLVRVVRQPPPAGAVECVGPCFLVASSEPGTVGLCRLGVFVVSPAGSTPPLLEQDVLVTDAPTIFTPGLLVVSDLGRVGGFELRLNGRVLGVASLSPVPPASLTAEGGFKPPPDFTWTAAAEDELIERLGRLGNQNG